MIRKAQKAQHHPTGSWARGSELKSGVATPPLLLQESFVLTFTGGTGVAGSLDGIRKDFCRDAVVLIIVNRWYDSAQGLGVVGRIMPPLGVGDTLQERARDYLRVSWAIYGSRRYKLWGT